MKKIITCILCILLAIVMVACAAKTMNDYSEEVILVTDMVAETPMSEKQAVNALLALNYSQKEIDIILEKVDVNWNYQALRVVQQELDVGPQSKLGLTKILEGLGFTAAQAQYGINTAEINWQEQCLYAAMNYIEQGLTKEQVATNIITDGFTSAEWNYVIAKHYNLLEN